MYHSLAMWDLADLIFLQRTNNLQILNDGVHVWEECLNKAYNWLSSMVHPDKEISFFNDATFSAAPNISDLQRYFGVLGITLPKPSFHTSLKAEHLSASGYAVINWPQEHRLITDIGFVGPNYQPGHAHADTLSCELSIFGKRVLVNSGISHYETNKQRIDQRSTAAHNTLEIDGKNSSEVWSSFRVARRAKPFNVTVHNAPSRVVINASHNGYRRLGRNVIHQRSWVAKPDRLIVSDYVYGRFNKALVYWHLHPNVKIERLLPGHCCFILPKGEKVLMTITGAEVEVVNTTWHPGFGRSINNKSVLLKLLNSKIVTQFHWGTT